MPRNPQPEPLSKSSGSHDGAVRIPRKFANPSIPAFVNAVSPSRIQRVGKRGVTSGDGCRTGGGVEVERCKAEEAHQEGDCGHDNFVQTRCMTGAQFLDLVVSELLGLGGGKGDV